MRARSLTGAWLLACASCVPSGSAGPQDAGVAASEPHPAASVHPPPPDVMKTPFEDNFERTGPIVASSTGGEGAPVVDPGPDWMATAPGIWHIEKGRLCGEHAHNHGLWLRRVLPTNARIEFDAISDSTDGDIKAEYWGDGRSYATSLSYTNATSYLTILGGWHNKFHVLARINEHASDRKEMPVEPNSDDPRELPVMAGQIYHFKVERTDGKTITWWRDNNEMFSFADPAPLAGPGHDHFGFNDWDVKLCFDNVRIVPLP